MRRNKRAVDLQSGQREPDQVAQGGVAHPEIVHHQPDTQLLKSAQTGLNRLSRLHQQALGHLQLQILHREIQLP